MQAFLTATENIPFTGAIVLMLAIGIIEILSLVSGLGVFDFLDGLLPDFDAGEIDTDLDADANGLADALIGWLNFGKVPFIISFLLFVFLFGSFGLKIQALAHSQIGTLLPIWLASPMAFALTIFPLKWLNAVMGKIMPKDETMAISPESFVGRVATIVIGEASSSRPAEAKLTGPLGRTHYIMVTSDNPEERFPQGSRVLIVGRQGSHFSVISVKNPHLQG